MALGRVVGFVASIHDGPVRPPCSRAPQRRAPRAPRPRAGGRGAARRPSSRAACAGSGRGGSLAAGALEHLAHQRRGLGGLQDVEQVIEGTRVAHSSSSRSKSRPITAAVTRTCAAAWPRRATRPRRPPDAFGEDSSPACSTTHWPLESVGWRRSRSGAGAARWTKKGLPSVSRKSVSASPRPSSLNAWPAAASMRDCTPFSSRPRARGG